MTGILTRLPFAEPDTREIDAALRSLDELGTRLMEGDFDIASLSLERGRAVVPSPDLLDLLAALRRILGDAPPAEAA